MRIYISIDMEGIWGLTSWKEPKEKISQMMTNEVKLVIESMKKHDRHLSVVVCDSHGHGDNIIPDLLPADVTLIRGFPRGYYMMEGLDSKFDGCLLLGYHAPAGVLPGQMDHSYSSSTFYRVVINGKEVGEAEINGFLAGYYQVPVLLISGDDVLYNFSKGNFPQTQFVVTKRSISRYSAELIPYLELIKRYDDAIEKAFASIDRIEPLEITPPFTIELELLDTSAAYLISEIPGSVLISGRKVSFSTSSFLDIYKFLIVASYIGWVNRNL